MADSPQFPASPVDCQPIIGSTLVDSDEHPMTATFSRQVAAGVDWVQLTIECGSGVTFTRPGRMRACEVGPSRSYATKKYPVRGAAH